MVRRLMALLQHLRDTDGTFQINFECRLLQTNPAPFKSARLWRGCSRWVEQSRALSPRQRGSVGMRPAAGCLDAAPDERAVPLPTPPARLAPT